MKTTLMAFMAIALCMTSYAKADLTVTPTATTDGWNGFMNVFETDANGGAFAFGSGWGIDHPTTGLPNDIGAFGADTISMRSASIDDADAFWFVSGAPGAGAVGNKKMEANLFKNFAEGTTELADLAGMDLTFEFTVDSFTYDSDVTLRAFIKEFDPGFSGVTETFIDITAAGDFSFTAPIAGTGGEVQYGFVTVNDVVWVDDADVNGGVTFAAVPEPTSLIVLGLGVIGLVTRRRR